MNNTIKRLGKTYDLNSLADLKELLAKDEEYLRISDGRQKLTKEIKKEANWLNMRIFRLEEPEMFENHRKALSDYVNNTNIFLKSSSIRHQRGAHPRPI